MEMCTATASRGGPGAESHPFVEVGDVTVFESFENDAVVLTDKNWFKIFISQRTKSSFLKKIYFFVVCFCKTVLFGLGLFYFSNIFDTVTEFLSCQIT